jgi:hypothetical protein
MLRIHYAYCTVQWTVYCPRTVDEVDDAGSVGSVEEQLLAQPQNRWRKGNSSNESTAVRETSQHARRCTRTYLGSPDPAKRQAIPAS